MSKGRISKILKLISLGLYHIMCLVVVYDYRDMVYGARQ